VATRAGALSAALFVGGCSGAGDMLDQAFVYFPATQWIMTPADAGLDYEDRWLQAGDGVRLHAWYVRHPQPRAHVLHFHGNAGNVSHRVPLYARLVELGLSVLAVDYRGYGRSGGRPSESGLYRDGLAAWDEVTGKLDVPAQGVIVAGRSLGSAIAAAIAGGRACRGVVLETPFTSVLDLARAHYPLLPVGRLLRSRYDTLGAVASVRSPTLVIEARNDEIIPRRLTDRLYNAVPTPAGRVRLAGGHNDFDHVSARGYHDAWEGFLIALESGADGSG